MNKTPVLTLHHDLVMLLAVDQDLAVAQGEMRSVKTGLLHVKR